MEWYDIIVLVVGALGGASGILSFYNAKPNRTRIEVEVLNKVIETLNVELNEKDKAFKEYRDEVDAKVSAVKKEVAADRAEKSQYRKAIYQAYRCKYPENLHDCPVIAVMEEAKEEHCVTCSHGA